MPSPSESLPEPEAIAWLNGAEVPFRELAVPAWDLGVVAGASVSEMARTYLHRPFRVQQHLNRLLRSCDELGFPCYWSAAELQSAAEDLVDANCALVEAGDDLGIVWFVTAGANPTYLGPGKDAGGTVGIHTFRLPLELWQKAAQDGLRLRTTIEQRASDASLPVHLKTRNRLHWWIADREAARQERGARALLTDSNGFITETSTAAIFVNFGGAIHTPTSSVLKSMSCRLVEEAAADLGVAFHRSDLSCDQLLTADEIFAGSTASGLLPVDAVNGIRFRNRVLLERFQHWYFEKTGIHNREQILASPAL